MTDIDPVTESLIFERIRELNQTIDIDESSLTPIQEFYKDANVFVTGCTGFLGQLLVEKVLRSCPISTLYLLVRGKKGKSACTRLDEIFDGVVFSRLKKIFPDFRDKIIIVEGDCQFPDLGLNQQDKQLLIKQVNIVFHVAATVRFDEKLNVATAINVRATRDLALLAQQMRKLTSFVQVSTAYGNCPGGIIEEKIYPPATKHYNLIQICKHADQALLDILTPCFIGMYPNTYTYSKQIAENIIKEEAKDLPVAIYRPAIVVSTYREPVRGWINNMYGATGALFGFGLGLLRVLRVDNQNNANIVPADMSINGLVASAWDVSERFKEAKEEGREYEATVYNYETSNDKPITWTQFEKWSSYYEAYTPSLKSIWYLVIYFVKPYPVYIVLTFLLHTVPGLIMDAILFCKGKKVRMVKIYKKIHKFSSVISYFSLKRLVFKSENIRKMLERMSERDNEIFFCDLKKLDWDEFFSTYIPGVRVHFLKEPLETVPAGRKHRRNLKIAHVTLKIVLWILALTITWYLVSSVYGTVFS